MNIAPTVWNGPDSASIYIGGVIRVGLNQQDHLIFFDDEHTLNMGPRNQRQIDELCEFLQRIKIHVPA